MYATAENFPLPPVLDQAPSPLHRRRHIGPFEPSAGDIDRFNRLLARLGRTRAPLQCDQLVTAARTLAAHDPGQPPACIRQRLQRAELIEQLLDDRDWQPAENVVPIATDVVRYLHGPWHLLPVELPLAAHLDDAIAIDTAWPRLVPELSDYRDFRRLRRIEAELRGCRSEDLPFDRAAWLQARQAEAELLAHRRRVRESSYAPEAPARFRVH
ncbi:hypothetical protein OK348_00725 [Flavobacterium sp. MXW15]|uniref:Uncharacterized protein n=1 Tax=Xanthomonas chitinilytica TaxID=2989819 RepID=A0ABT3JUZ6_9XANT|nr:hypothetical protein [Xanthomonas sp. H13-6]MCW4453325.1 hypothetical protein [Flavobacterium sp. MXW15]MCW4472322.1 hypothetical protein [Xanthomonas sp. H13-6]